MNDSKRLPAMIFLLSGKRKSGKDFVSELLLERLGTNNAVIIRLSAPIKSYWAETNNLQFNELLSSGQYKENYRKAMIEWSEKMRHNDYGYFCRAAIKMTKGADSKSFWIISDARRKTDFKWFNENYPNVTIKSIRLVSSEDVRKARGWVFEKGVDDAESECDLDTVEKWDLIIQNNNDDKEFYKQFNALVDMCRT